MWQSVITYGIVAVAGSWVAWTVLLPNEWRSGLRRRARAALGRATPAPTDGACGNCGCGKTD
jgi:hypothetical protein